MDDQLTDKSSCDVVAYRPYDFDEHVAEYIDIDGICTAENVGIDGIYTAEHLNIDEHFWETHFFNDSELTNRPLTHIPSSTDEVGTFVPLSDPNNQLNRFVNFLEQEINMKKQMNLANILYERSLIAKSLTPNSARYFKILFVGGQLNGGIMVDKLIQVFKKACLIESINQIYFEETFFNFFSDCYIHFHWKGRLSNLTPDAIEFDLTTKLAPKCFNTEQKNVRKRVTNTKSKCKKYFANIVQQIFNDQPM